MHVGRALESLATPQPECGAARDLHGEFAVEHIHEHLGIVAVRQRGASRQILNRQHDEFLAGHTHEILGHQLPDDLSRKVGPRAGGERKALRQGKCGHENHPRMIATHDLSRLAQKER